MSRTGYKTANFSYVYVSRKGILPQKNLLFGFRKALSVLVFNSTVPLRIMNVLGLMGSLLGVMISLFSLLLKLFTDIPVPGWTSLSLFVSVEFSIMFLILFFYGEYMARLVDEQKAQREYNVEFEKHSSVMTNINRWNVTNESVNEALGAVQTGKDR
jgi:hypothetical protein